VRILVASKFWYHRGGLERVILDEVAALEARGHQTAAFATQHPDTISSEWQSYFVPYLELGSGGGKGPIDSVRAAVRMFDNRPAARLFSRLVSDFEPDLVHIHGIHRQISPSILGVAEKAGLPVVQTLHDYHHICPADTLLRSGEVQCMPPSCGYGHYGHAIRNACMSGSRSRSGLSAAEMWFQRRRGIYERVVKRFIAPSRFMADAMRAGGWRTPIDVIPNAVPVVEADFRRTATDRPYVLYAGRLASEKGVDIALEAARLAGMPMIVAGEGPAGAQLRRRHPEAKFVGYRPGSEVEALLDGAAAAVVPSIWFENASMAVLEAMAHGTPVVASRIGGIPEQVTDGVEGFLADPGAVDQFASAFRQLLEDPTLAQRMGEAGRARMTNEYTTERHMDLLLETYRRAMDST